MKKNRRKNIMASQNTQEGVRIHLGKKVFLGTLIDKRPGGIAVAVTKQKHNSIQPRTGKKLTVEMLLETGKFGKKDFIIKHITPNSVSKYIIGLQYSDGTKLSPMQRQMMVSAK